MAVSQLESRFLATEENFDKVIASSRAMLEKDKQELQLQLGQGVQLKSNSDIVRTNNVTSGSPETSGISIDIGGYEKLTPKQKQLKDERQREYRQYLKDQKIRSDRANTEVSAGLRGENTQALSSKEEYRKKIDKDYNNLLKKKKEQEKVYRVQFNTNDDDDDAGKREEVYVLDSRDNDLIELLKSRRRGKSADKKRSEKFKDMRDEFSENGRSNSVPLNVPPILGGNSNTKLNKEKKQQYKMELEQQIQEKELLKAKEKLKRLGRITSECDITEIEIPKNSKNKWALPVRKSETASGTYYNEKKLSSRKYPEQHHYQEQQPSYQSNYSQNQQFVNPYYPPQTFSMNPMYGNMQPMAPNPMMQWQNAMQPAFQPMMGSQFNSSGGAQMMHGYQGYKDPPNNNNSRKNSARNRKNWDIPPLDLDGSTNRNDYVPSKTEDKTNIPRRPNVQPPGGGSHGLFNSPISNNDYGAAQKKAKQMEYQKELQKQMEIKKEKQEKAKTEQERYEQKLEQELQGYDPWGRDGGGAPVRNKDGHVVANLKKYQKDAETTTATTATATTPKHVQFDDPTTNFTDIEDSPILKALVQSMNKGLADSINKGNFHTTFKSPNSSGNSGNNKSSPKSYARGAALKELKGIGSESPRDKEERDEYKLFLQQQVEEKRQKEEAAKLKAKEEEMKEAKRIEEQQRKMKEEFEREKESQRKKEEELRKNNEELKMMAEKKRFEEEARQKKIDQEMEQEFQHQAKMKLERRNEEEVVQVVRTNSPPIPTVAKQQRKKEFERRLSETKELQQRQQQQQQQQIDSLSNDDIGVRLPSSSTTTTTKTIRSNTNNKNFSAPGELDVERQKHQLASDTEYLNTVRQSMEIQKKINESNVQQQNDLLKQLAVLRKQLQSQEKKIHTELHMNKVKYTELRTVGKPKADDVFSKATKKINSDLNASTD